MTNTKKQKTRALANKTGMSYQAASNTLRGEASKMAFNLGEEMFAKVVQEMKETARSVQEDPIMFFSRKWPKAMAEMDKASAYGPVFKATRRGGTELGVHFAFGRIHWFPASLFQEAIRTVNPNDEAAKKLAFMKWFQALPESSLSFPVDEKEITHDHKRVSEIMLLDPTTFKGYVSWGSHRFTLIHKEKGKSFYVPYSVMAESEPLYAWWQKVPNGEELDLLEERTSRALEYRPLLEMDVLKYYDTWKHLPSNLITRHRDKLGRRIGIEIEGVLYWIFLTDLKGKKEVYTWWKDTIWQEATEKPVYK